MMRLSIDISQEQHQRLTASASLRGQTLSDYVLERALAATEEEAAVQRLEAFLEVRLQQTEEVVTQKSVRQIFEEVRRNMLDHAAL